MCSCDTVDSGHGSTGGCWKLSSNGYSECCLDRRILPQVNDVLRALTPKAAQRGLIPRSIQTIPFWIIAPDSPSLTASCSGGALNPYWQRGERGPFHWCLESVCLCCCLDKFCEPVLGIGWNKDFLDQCVDVHPAVNPHIADVWSVSNYLVVGSVWAFG